MKDFKNMKDSDFDKLFQESADKSVPDFNESSWDKMAELLDDNEAPVATWWKKPLVYSGIVLLLLSISYIGFKTLDKKNTVGDVKTAQLETNSGKLNTPETLKSDENGTIKEGFDDAPSENRAHLESKPQALESKARELKEVEVQSKIEKKLINKAQNRVGETTGGLDNNIALERNLKSNKEVNKFSEISIAERISSEKNAGQNVPIIPVSSDNNYQNKKDKQLIEPSGFVLNKIPKKNYAPFEIGFKPSITSSPKKVVTTAMTVEEIMPKGFALRLALSPDFSVVPENAFFKVGHNWAALLEYRFNNKWSVQTGVIKSLKYYQASPAQYEWPASWGDAPAELNQIDARCSMIDVPINLRYDFTTTRNRWFAQVGVTSYLMLKENYDYVFASNYNDQVWKSWEGKTGFYTAGVINLSGGIEKRIFNKMSVQIEPFFKVPVGKVGYGKVKLATAGIFISTKLPFKK